MQVVHHDRDSNDPEWHQDERETFYYRDSFLLFNCDERLFFEVGSCWSGARISQNHSRTYTKRSARSGQLDQQILLGNFPPRSASGLPLITVRANVGGSRVVESPLLAAPG